MIWYQENVVLTVFFADFLVGFTLALDSDGLRRFQRERKMEVANTL